jgi:hypothetical protein
MALAAEPILHKVYVPDLCQTNLRRMSDAISRRDALKHLAASGAGMMFAGVIRSGGADIIVAGQPVEIAVWSLSRVTVRITVRPLGWRHEANSDNRRARREGSTPLARARKPAVAGASALVTSWLVSPNRRPRFTCGPKPATSCKNSGSMRPTPACRFR